MNRTLGVGMNSTRVKEMSGGLTDYLLSCSVGRVRAGCGFQVSGVGSEILEPFWRKRGKMIEKEYQEKEVSDTRLMKKIYSLDRIVL